MAENKMTQKEMFALIAEAMADNAEVVEFCEKKIAQLEKPRKPRVNQEAADFAERVAEFLGEAAGPMTNKELAEALEVSAQKMSAALKRLGAEDRVIRIEGEKKSDKATFVLA